MFVIFSSIPTLSVPKTIIKLIFFSPSLVYVEIKLPTGVNGDGPLVCPGLSSTHIISTPTG